MPWRVRKKPIKGEDDWAIQKKVNGKWKIVGRSSTKENAKASIIARRISEDK